jgi:hypothetical protein
VATDLGPIPPLPEGLRDRWRASSVESVWLRPSDWYHPAVDVLAEAVLHDADPCAAAEELGRARGYDGVGITESLDDLACLYRSTGVPTPPLAAIRALAEGWADGAAAGIGSGAALDAETGLPTKSYLELRLRETYEAGEAGGHRLVVVDVAAGEVSGLLRAARSAAAGAALTAAFGGGHPMATLGGGVFVALVRPRDDLDAQLDRLRADLAARCADVEVRVAVRQPVRAWTEPLPATHDAAVRLLGRLVRFEH